MSINMDTKLIPKRIDKNEKIVFYKLRNNQYNEWYGAGLKLGGHGKVWNTLGHVKNAINSAITYYQKEQKDNILKSLEVIEFTFTIESQNKYIVSIINNKLEMNLV